MHLRRSLRLRPTLGRERVSKLFTAIIRFSTKRFAWRVHQTWRGAAFQVLEDHGNQAHIGDSVADEGVAHELRPQRTEVHHARAADKRADKAHHKIDGMIGRQNA